MEGSEFTVKEIVLDIRADLKEHLREHHINEKEQEERFSNLETSKTNQDTAIKILGLIFGGAITIASILIAIL